MLTETQFELLKQYLLTRAKNLDIKQIDDELYFGSASGTKIYVNADSLSIKFKVVEYDVCVVSEKERVLTEEQYEWLRKLYDDALEFQELFNNV